MNARRFFSLAGTVAVTVIAAVGSYDHMRELALMAGQSPFLATLLPLSVDGMILVATLALGDGRRSRWSAWLAFLVGVAASLAANVIVAEPNAISRVVSAWPAVALLLTVEVLARSGKRQTVPASDQQPLPISDQQPAAPLPLPEPAVPASVSVSPAPEPVADSDSEPVQPSVPARISKPRKQRQHVVPAHPERSDSGKVDPAEIARRADELKPKLGTWQKVAEELGMSVRTLQNYRKAVTA
ncbi:DUF2637 domain-containing protein [Micromonospora sp. CPCC 206171]|uniref:DUF2637 domain-containing protein n=1 Tax=Micromonospora sp. CPCC 206171 TaxID=3122405 RepID=UPI002FEEAC59